MFTGPQNYDHKAETQHVKIWQYSDSWQVSGDFSRLKNPKACDDHIIIRNNEKGKNEKSTFKDNSCSIMFLASVLLPKHTFPFSYAVEKIISYGALPSWGMQGKEIEKLRPLH